MTSDAWVQHYAAASVFTPSSICVGDAPHPGAGEKRLKADASRCRSTCSTTASVSSGSRSRCSSRGDAEEDLQSVAHDRKALFTAMVNLTKCIAGSGVLCLPFALQEGGAQLGLGCLLLTGVFSLGGFLAIGRTCHLTGATTYREAWVRTVGVCPGVLDAMIFLECVITCVGYIMLILDYLGTAISGIFGISADGHGIRECLAACLAVGVLFPLCLKRSLSSLRITSLFGNVAVMYTIFYVITECLHSEGLERLVDILMGEEAAITADSSGRGWRFWESAPELSQPKQSREGVFRAVCVMTSAYIAHYSAPDAVASLAGHRAPWKAFQTASSSSFGLVVVLYSMFALTGFARFVPFVQGNVLLNYDSGLFILLAWLSMAMTLVLSFPLAFKSARDILASALALEPREDSKSRGGFAVDEWSQMTVLAVSATVFLGVMLTDISTIVAFRGALLGCPISFIVPGLMLRNCPGSAGMERSTLAFCSWSLIVFGTAAGALGLYCAMAGN
eukprot:TRINITY_DN11974_c0_g1_i1.p1 TRINITY_DN11974_c0_g1~~TRINITY_DN11974_c0_g1_i1.p1  ORF type:complete len:505 (-),score=65.00 TRINITY_DN11974_c0_g1_i1:811-2325(-)